MPLKTPTVRKIVRALIVLAVIGAIVGGLAWYKFFREVSPPRIADDARWFKYGSLGGEKQLGIPYWIWIVLPRIFPDYTPGPGGYTAFGLAWEEGEELPIGFTKRTVGFPRVGNNCALCHVAKYRLDEQENPRFALGAPAHSFQAQAMFDYLTKAANDARFNSATILREIDQMYDLGWFDRLTYRLVIIPLTRKALIKQGQQLAWAARPGKSPWGPGRDDAFNLPKYFLAHLPEDQSHGPCDFNSAWNLRVRKGTNLLLNWAGETPAVYSVLVDSSVGVGARPGRQFDADMQRLDKYLSGLQPQRWPFTNGPNAIKPALAEAGRQLYGQHCAACHEPGRDKCNTVIPIQEIGTDRERLDSWSQEAADKTNRAINDGIGARRPNLVKNHGYLAGPLDGLWLRGPFLHNGSVPNLRELLEPTDKRSRRFYRGYDVFDPANVGFVSTGAVAARVGFLHDVSARANGNGGHLYGTGLSQEDKELLLEFLKTL